MGTMKTDEHVLSVDGDYTPKFMVEGDFQKEIAKVIIGFNEKRPEAIVSQDSKMLASYITDLGGDSHMQQIEQVKKNGKQYKGKFIGLEYYPETMEITKAENDDFRVIVVVPEQIKEVMSENKNAEMKEMKEKKKEYKVDKPKTYQSDW